MKAEQSHHMNLLELFSQAGSIVLNALVKYQLTTSYKKIVLITKTNYKEKAKIVVPIPVLMGL